MTGRILILALNDSRKKNVLLDELNKLNGVDAYCIFKPVASPFRLLRRMAFKVGRGQYYWYADWKYDIRKYSMIICFASRYSYSILQWIIKRNHKARAINYYWDKISISHYPVRTVNEIENWTFDLDDSIRFGMAYNPQFYVNIKWPAADIKYDISFVGSNRKGGWNSRDEIVDTAYREFSILGLKLYFYYYAGTHGKARRDYYREKPLPESEYYKICSQSKAILELVEPGEEWLTLRPFQALNNKIKLVTNNPKIKNYSFYSSDNIFILGLDDIGGLIRFLNSPFHVMEQDGIERYSAHEWVNRF